MGRAVRRVPAGLVMNQVADGNIVYCDSINVTQTYNSGFQISGLFTQLRSSGLFTGITSSDVEGGGSTVVRTTNFYNGVATNFAFITNYSVAAVTKPATAFGTQQPTLATTPDVSIYLPGVRDVNSTFNLSTYQVDASIYPTQVPW